MTSSTAAAHVLTTGVLDADDALTLLEQVVNEWGRNRGNTTGTYFQGYASDEYASTPMDLVGHMIDKLGKSLYDLKDLDDPDASWDAINNCWFSSIGIDGIEITDNARTLIYETQLAESGGSNWGRQLDAAEHYRNNMRGHALLAAA